MVAEEHLSDPERTRKGREVASTLISTLIDLNNGDLRIGAKNAVDVITTKLSAFEVISTLCKFVSLHC